VKPKESRWKRFMEKLPFVGGGAALGQGLAKQVGNVTECALLGFIQDLGNKIKINVHIICSYIVII
jgi:hypothetical protein